MGHRKMKAYGERECRGRYVLEDYEVQEPQSGNQHPAVEKKSEEKGSGLHQGETSSQSFYGVVVIFTSLHSKGRYNIHNSMNEFLYTLWFRIDWI